MGKIFHKIKWYAISNPKKKAVFETAHQGELMRFHMAERVIKKNYPDMRIPMKKNTVVIIRRQQVMLDYDLPTEQAYHCGASSKDAGKKLCAINVIADTSMIHPIIGKLLLALDKQI